MKAPTPNGPSTEQLKNLRLYLEAGLTLRLAANAIGVTEATVKAWIAQDPQLEIAIGAADAA